MDEIGERGDNFIENAAGLYPLPTTI